MYRQKDIREKTLLFFGLFSFGLVIAFLALSGNYLFLQNRTERFFSGVKTQLLQLLPTKATDPSLDLIKRTTQSCSVEKSHINGIKPTAPLLQRLAELEKLCGSAAAQKMLIFITMPNSTVAAQRMAQNLSATLREFDKYNIDPVVIVEPETAWGLVDFNEFGSGFYNIWLEAFFEQLKTEKITDSQMGTWVPFPEANLPYWNTNTSKPDQFGKNVTIYVGIMRRYFPKAKASILLNAASYPSNDLNWENGTYTSLIPYIKSIPAGLLDSFGIQGFPWRSPASTKKPLLIYDPVEFLSPDLAIEAAKYLNIKEIWVNTGTFKSKYTKNADLLVSIDAATRQKILTDILTQTEYIKNKGFSLSVNIFGQDKSNTPEATDWSYWGKNIAEVNADTIVLLNFIGELSRKGLGFWYFDYLPPATTPTVE